MGVRAMIRLRTLPQHYGPYRAPDSRCEYQRAGRAWSVTRPCWRVTFGLCAWLEVTVRTA